MTVSGMLRLLAVLLTALALGLAGVAGAEECAPVKMESGGRSGKAAKRAPRGRG